MGGVIGHKDHHVVVPVSCLLDTWHDHDRIASLTSLSNMGPRQFLLHIVGDSGSGKTSFVSRNSYLQLPDAIIGDDENESTWHYLDFDTNLGRIRFSCHDHHGGIETLNDEMFHEGDCIILLIDVTNITSLVSLPTWTHSIVSRNARVPVVLCGNKVDAINDRRVQPIMVLEETIWQYYEISALANFNFEKPFMYLIRKLMDNQDIHFAHPVNLLPPTIMLSEEARAQIEENYQTARGLFEEVF
ncbi:hypothetical protein E3N88_36032 [Mikania micrantha]|uniref:Tr-type G domain-containing protein n=1 Tax=Mikania micrantha TaxID=192012 RepID=A0A5N6M310_9ASTR|nr:hypothetical protein E3N88_36032 [Mikania micrantha]